MYMYIQLPMTSILNNPPSRSVAYRIFHLSISKWDSHVFHLLVKLICYLNWLYYWTGRHLNKWTRTKLSLIVHCNMSIVTTNVCGPCLYREVVSLHSVTCLYIAITYGPFNCGLYREVVSLYRLKYMVVIILVHVLVVLYREVVFIKDGCILDKFHCSTFQYNFIIIISPLYRILQLYTSALVHLSFPNKLNGLLPSASNKKQRSNVLEYILQFIILPYR